MQDGLLYWVLAPYSILEKRWVDMSSWQVLFKRVVKPPPSKAHVSEPCASTNSAIWAILQSVDLNVTESSIKLSSNLIGIISFGS